MNTVLFIKQFLFKIKYWIIIAPAIAGALAYFWVRDQPEVFTAKTQIYTGVISNADAPVEGSGSAPNWFILNNILENMTSVISSYNTLDNVSLHLFTQHVVHGDINRDNEYINAENYQNLLANIPKEVLELVDKSSEEKTFEKLLEYKNLNKENYLYKLFNSTVPYYSYQVLSRIEVGRVNTTDVLELKYSSDDRGITVQTLNILNKEFINQYEDLRYGESEGAIIFLQDEMKKYEDSLKQAEDSLRRYSTQNNILDYGEQAKSIIAMNHEIEMKEEQIRLDYSRSRAAVKTLELQISGQSDNLKNNSELLSKIKEVSDLSSQITMAELFENDQSLETQHKLNRLKSDLYVAEKRVKSFADKTGNQKYTTEGVPVVNLVDTWLQETMLLEKAKAEYKVISVYKANQNSKYSQLLSAGSKMKQKEREVNSREQSYMALLNGLYSAQMQQKTLQMKSASLKVITPPTYVKTAYSRKSAMTMLAAIACFIFIVGVFLILEFIDRRLLNKLRTERITSQEVIGAYPLNTNPEATQYLGNIILNSIKPNAHNVVNIISLEDGDGKAFIANKIAEFLSMTELSVRVLSWEKNISCMSKQYLMAASINDLYPGVNEDVIIIEHPPLTEYNISAGLLKCGCLNLFIAKATHKWKSIDQVQLDTVVERAEEAPTFIYLNQVKNEEMKIFIGNK